MYRHILIPTDGSSLAHHAVEHGLALAKAVGAQVTFLAVEPKFDFLSVMPAVPDPLADEFAAIGKETKVRVEHMLRELAHEGRAAGVACDTVHLRHNQPYECIVGTAKQKGCDLIVMASHGRGGIAAVILGSVTTKVLTHSDLPVLVCH